MSDKTLVWEAFSTKTPGKTVWNLKGLNMPEEATFSNTRLRTLRSYQGRPGTLFSDAISEDGNRLTFDFTNGTWVYELEAVNDLFFKAVLVEGDPLYALETQVE